MEKHSALLTALFLVTGEALCGTGFDPVALARGGTWLRARADLWAVISCQPLLADIHGTSAGIFHSPGLFGLPELSGSAAALTFRMGPGGAGLALTHFGYPLYREVGVGAAYGAGSGTVRLGAVLRVKHLSIAGYGSAVTLAVDGGLIVRPDSVLHLGMMVENANRPSKGGSGERSGPDLSAECAFLPRGPLEISLHAGRGYGGSFDYRAGITGRLPNGFTMSCGVSARLASLHAGIETEVSGLRFSYGVVTHTDLGWTHFLAVAWIADG